MKIDFQINLPRTVQCILYVIDRMGGEVNQYNLMKIMFAADKDHLNQHAVPVTGDKYIKMHFGTVPSAIYDMVNSKGLDDYLNDLDINNLPFKLIEKDGKNFAVVSSTKANKDYLSETNIESLDKGIEEYGKLTFAEVKEKNHKERSWQEAKHNEAIDFELMIDNKEVLKYLLEHSFGIAV